MFQKSLKTLIARSKHPQYGTALVAAGAVRTPRGQGIQTMSRLYSTEAHLAHERRALSHELGGNGQPPGISNLRLGSLGNGSLDQVGIDLLYLRDSCSCPRCVNPSTRQKLFETSELSPYTAVRDFQWLPDGSLEISWENDINGLRDHQSTFSKAFLEQSQSSEHRVRASGNLWEPVTWNKSMLENEIEALTFQYDDYMTHDKVLQQLVNQLHVFGLAFVKSVPGDPDVLKPLAHRIGPLKQTFYGETFDVKSEPSPINVAYTADELDFHMDLLYLTDPPSIQMLHCIKQSVQGGESRFVDGVRVFTTFQEKHPHLIQPLVEFPVTYRYKNNGHWFQKTRTFLEGGILTGPESTSKSQLKFNYPGDYESLNWSPPFQGPFEQVEPLNLNGSSISFRDYVKAANTFKQLLADEHAIYEAKLEEGTCVIFNNRRVLHARRPFQTNGSARWLKGCYVDGDYLRDRYRVLSAAT